MMIMWGECFDCIPLQFVHGPQQVGSGTQILIHFIKGTRHVYQTNDSLCFSISTKHRQTAYDSECEKRSGRDPQHRGTWLREPRTYSRSRSKGTPLRPEDGETSTSHSISSRHGRRDPCFETPYLQPVLVQLYFPLSRGPPRATTGFHMVRWWAGQDEQG